MNQKNATTKKTTITDIGQINSLISHDMISVNKLIEISLSSDVPLINQLGQYIVNTGGKRLRPALVIISSKIFSYKGNQHINLAAIIELIHTATLLHDDVVDMSKIRHSKDTANIIWGNKGAVLVGDFLYSRAFEIMVEPNSMEIMKILSKATNQISEGEVLQLLNIKNASVTQKEYYRVIERKTISREMYRNKIKTYIKKVESLITEKDQKSAMELQIIFGLQQNMKT